VKRREIAQGHSDRGEDANHGGPGNFGQAARDALGARADRSFNLTLLHAGSGGHQIVSSAYAPMLAVVLSRKSLPKLKRPPGDRS
jgi:hypothetical protein